MKTQVPYDIEPSWFLESGRSPKLFCRGCGSEVDDSEGFNTQHDILDCLMALKKRISDLEAT